MKEINKYSNSNAHTLRNAIKVNPAMAYILNKIKVISPAGKKALLNSPWLTDKQALEEEYSVTDSIITADTCNHGLIENICRQLMSVRDISGSIFSLETDTCLDDISLFEIKNLALVSREVNRLMSDGNIKFITIPNLNDIVELLDPERTGVPHFYIYDAYSETLRDTRKLLNMAIKGEDTESISRLYAKCNDIENNIRECLTESLRCNADKLLQTLDLLGRLDLVIARANLAQTLHLSRPVITTDIIEYKGLWNPQVSDVLESRHQSYQPIDIKLMPGITVVTGANMAGKSLTLKTLVLAQMMAQYGFHVSASNAKITPVEYVMTSIGDSQSELSGLSSYASEMLCINNITSTIKTGALCLAAIDEPARTTNPDEGRAIVNAVIDILNRYNSFSILTTHYSGLSTSCRRLRVHGFREDKVHASQISASNINDYIDYSLEECDDIEAPREALRIARLIGIDPIITDTASQYLDN